MRSKVWRYGGAAVLLLASASGVRGQGASFYAHGACTTARAGAAVASPCADGSAVYYNPAALGVRPSAASAGVSVVRLESEFTYDRTLRTFESTGGAELVPSLFATHRVGRRLAVGVGLWAPYGLTTEWPTTFEGRFIGYETTITGIYIQPTVSYELIPGRLSIGGGLDVVRGGVELHRRLDLAVQQAAAGIRFAQLGIPLGTDFADVTLEGSAWTFAGQLALHARLGRRISLGARWMAPATLEVDDGEVTFDALETGLVLPPENPLGFPAGTPVDALIAPLFAAGGPLTSQSLSTELTFPAQAVVGARVRALDRLDLLFDYQWTGWSSFDEVELDFETAPDQTLELEWEDTHTFRAGAEYAVRGGVRLRGGFAYNTAATPDRTVTPLLPESDRHTYTLGAGIPIGDRLHLGLALERAVQEDRRGRVRSSDDFFGVPVEELNVGVYEGTGAWLGAATLVYRLGGGR